MSVSRDAVSTELRIAGDGRRRPSAVVERVNLIPSELRARLIENGARTASHASHDPHPVVRLYTPDAAASWLLTELDPDDPDLAYGLCDLGLGAPRLDHVRLSQLAALADDAVMCDTGFVARQPLSAYLREARERGAIRP